MTHRDAPVTCSACGKRVPRKGRSQAYCSRRCRQRAYWDRKAIAKISTIVTHGTGHSTTPRKSPNKINALGGRKWRPTDFGKAPLNLLGGGLWRWSETPPLDPLIRTKIIAAEIGESEVKGASRLKARFQPRCLRAPNGCEPTAFVFRRDAKST